MTVYVDDAIHPYGRMLMCHMASPDLDELHAMADRIGVARKWFQDPRVLQKVSRPHYDIAKGKRDLAIKAGAVAVDKYQMSVISNVAMARLMGVEIDPLRIFRARAATETLPFERSASQHLPRLEAWLAAQLGDRVVQRARQDAV